MDVCDRFLKKLIAAGLAVLWIALPVFSISGEIAPPKAPEALAFFETKIRPVLVENCFKCHSAGAEKLKAGLLLDSRKGMLTGGDTGPAIVAGKPDDSLLLEAVSYTNVDLQMPPKERLTGNVIADFAKWIAMGAPWPDTGTSEPQHKPNPQEDFDLAKRKANHWAWRPVAIPPVPEPEGASWSDHPIDRFVLAKLHEHELQPSPAADRRTLIRRLYFDLIGLPPSPEQVESFLRDKSTGAYAKVVDELLESPHFGERWARHWLDLVRYGETRGHEFDPVAANAFRYRDYVIRALNADVPYNQFVTEHIAGDLLPEPRVHPHEGFNESVIGTGFWFLGETIHSPVDIKQDEADRFDNMVDVASKSFLGLTVACARCHDHKFDAISTKDYYAMFGYLQSSNYHQAQIDSMLPNQAIAEKMRRLAKQAKHDLAASYKDALRKGLKESSTYLQAALHENPGSGVSAKAPEEINAARLARWREAVQEDPYLKPLTSEVDWAGNALSKANAFRAACDALDIIADYAAIAEDLFIQDGGFAFGLAPVRPGSIRLDEQTSGNPIAKVETYGAARHDEKWSQIEVVDSMTDPASKTSQQPGRMLRTPTFVLNGQGSVHYLVKGEGTAMAVVDSHRLVNGPLHGNVHRHMHGKKDLRWERHELSRYVGHNLHIEFVPKGNEPFEILLVAQSGDDKLPEARNFEEPPLGMLASALSEAGSAVDSRARAFENYLHSALAQWANSESYVLQPEQARAIDWLVHHMDLFVDDSASALEPARKIAETFRRNYAELAEGMVLKSRTVLAMMDGTPVDDHVYIRGNYKSPGDVVPRRFLEALGGTQSEPPQKGSGRLQLAQRIVDPKNPFVSRVIVNRLWHHLFGRGIVPTTDDFGVLGQRPSHPPLLDHLAQDFIAGGWSIKRQIRSIVTSKTYKMSSNAANMAAEKADPQNIWLHRANVRRLQGEAIRDALLAVSGRLDPTMFGSPVPVHLTGFMTGRGRPGKSGPLDGNGRRSVYLEVRRNFLNPMMLAFDTPIPFNTMGRRSVSNVPSQALILMNDPFVLQQARIWAERILALKLAPSDAVDHMYLEAFSRPATSEERSAALAFAASHASELDTEANSPEVWAALAHVLVNAKDFIFVN